MYNQSKIKNLLKATAMNTIHGHAVERFAELQEFKMVYDSQTIKDMAWWLYITDDEQCAYLSLDESSKVIENRFYSITEEDDCNSGILESDNPLVSQFTDESNWEKYVKQSLWNFGTLNLPFPVAVFGADVYFYPTIVCRDGVRRHEPSPLSLFKEISWDVLTSPEKMSKANHNNELTEKEAWQKYIDYCQEKISQTTSAHDALYYRNEVAKCKQELSRLSD